ncbi:MAG: hypothetical protein UY04_C0020G0017 [Parcubacteria group bacterium GW2011_GWA2_47_7]|nr:MAG: hypothetical protein UY04_C0020G0017 [Parcubacteria group bacterium GW2011_GWA2_47_7]
MKRLYFLFRALCTTRFLVRRLLIKFIERETRGRHYSTVVDVGCGTTPHRKYFDCKKYIGVDIVDHGGVPNLVISDVNNGIQVPDKAADMVLCSELLEHTKRPEFVIAELHRITKGGGTVLFTAPMVWPIHEEPNDYYRFTNFGLEYLFTEAGFSSVRIEAWNGHWYAMCQLSLLYMRHWIFRPIVICINILGVVIFKFEKNRNLSLGYSVVAVK